MNIHPSFRDTKILAHIADLIIDYKYHNYNDLTDEDKLPLVALLIKASGHSDEFNWITENVHSDQTINSFIKLLEGQKEAEFIFLETIKSNAIDYYDSILKALFEYVYEDYVQSRYEWLDKMAKEGDPDMAHDQYRNNLIYTSSGVRL